MEINRKFFAALARSVQGDPDDLFEAIFEEDGDAEMMEFTVAEMNITPANINAYRLLKFAFVYNADCAIWLINWANLNGGHVDQTSMRELGQRNTREHIIRVVDLLQADQPLQISKLFALLIGILSRDKIEDAQHIFNQYFADQRNHSAPHYHTHALRVLSEHRVVDGQVWIREPLAAAQWWVEAFAITDEEVLRNWTGEGELHPYCPLVKNAS